jgi:hypothetical protein
MNAKTHPANQVPAIGAAFEGGFYTGNVRMGDAIYAVVSAPKAKGEFKGVWLKSYTDVPGARSYFDGLANTIAMAEAGSALAKKVLALEIEGIGGWSIPARDVLELQYRHFKPTTQENYVYRAGDNPSSVPAGYPYTEAEPAQTSLALFQAGGTEAFEDDVYLSSTQYSDYTAWMQYFGYGNQGNTSKEFERRCRAVRLIQLTA